MICTFWMILEFLKFLEIKIYFPKLSDLCGKSSYALWTASFERMIFFLVSRIYGESEFCECTQKSGMSDITSIAPKLFAWTMFWLTYSRAWYRFVGTCNRARCREPVAASGVPRVKGATRRSAPSDVAVASRRNLRRLIDSSRQIARCGSIDGYTRLHGKGELSRRPRYVMLELRREYYGHIHIESRAGARAGCLSFFHFFYTSTFDVLYVAVHCSRVPAVNHYAFFWNGKPARRVAFVE